MLGKKLKNLRHTLGISQRELANKLAVSSGTVAMWETNKREPDFEMLLKIANFFSVSTDVLLREDTELKTSTPNSKWIPVLGKVAAGIPIEAIEDILNYEEIDEAMAKKGEYFALSIAGDSMEPKISSGDVVIVRKQPDIESGEIAIVKINGEDATCKKVIKHEQGISLISFNPAYEPKFYTNDEISKLPVVIIGKVVELRAKF